MSGQSYPDDRHWLGQGPGTPRGVLWSVAWFALRSSWPPGDKPMHQDLAAEIADLKAELAKIDQGTLAGERAAEAVYARLWPVEDRILASPPARIADVVTQLEVLADMAEDGEPEGLVSKLRAIASGLARLATLRS